MVVGGREGTPPYLEHHLGQPRHTDFQTSSLGPGGQVRHCPPLLQPPVLQTEYHQDQRGQARGQGREGDRLGGGVVGGRYLGGGEKSIKKSKFLGEKNY